MQVKDTFTVDMFVERFSLEKSKEPVCTLHIVVSPFKAQF